MSQGIWIITEEKNQFTFWYLSEGRHESLWPLEGPDVGPRGPRGRLRPRPHPDKVPLSRPDQPRKGVLINSILNQLDLI